MRNSSLFSSVCRTNAKQGSPLWLLSMALVLILSACGQAAAGNDTEQTTEDANTDEDAKVDNDTTDDAKTDNNDTKQDDAKDGGSDTTVVGCTSDSDCKDTPTACHIAKCVNNTCSYDTVPAAAGTKCDDGKACNGADQCDAAGTCQGGKATVYGKDKDGKDNLCQICSCDNNPDGTCAVLSNNVGGTCDDGNNCTVNDTCAAGGTCKGSAKICSEPSNPCSANICDPTDGQCKLQADTTKDGTPCDDGDKCLEEDTCAGGACKGTKTVTCNDNSPCTDDACDKTKGCVYSPVTIPAGQTIACDDGNACTTDDKCTKAGKCNGTDSTKGVDLLPCQTVACDPKTGVLTYAGAKDGTGCDDGQVCTKQDTCQGQVCKGIGLLCNDDKPCTDDACDPLKCDASGLNCGKCAFVPKADNAACDDGNKCTSGDACTNSQCQGTPTDCDDKNACTNDSCLPASGCLHTPVATAVFCDDGDNCTIVDKCNGATCKGQPKDCADTDLCTQDSCDGSAPAASNCIHAKFDGPCNDGDGCTTNDLCLNGKCAGIKNDCNDNNPCTIDYCQVDATGKGGCINKPVSASVPVPCDDGLACTQNEVCDGGKCHTVLPSDNKCVSCGNDAACAKYNDQNVCNGTIKCMDSYLGKVCDTDQTTVIKCDATKDNSCAKNTCDPNSGACGMVNLNLGTVCTGDKCLSSAQCDGAGTCKGLSINCDDGNPCTIDACDSTTGCKHTNLADNTNCDDGSNCTAGQDTCLNGKCQNASPNKCTCATDSDCNKPGLDDGNLCNGILTCNKTSGLCEPNATTVVKCQKSANTCEDLVCTPSTGSCDPVAKPDNTACTDVNQDGTGDNVCTVGDTCKSGACKPGTPADCDDKNPCTVDFCDTVSGCDHAPIASGGLCDDGNICTEKDSCKTGSCVGTPLDCDDKNACTIDSCDKKLGCTHTVDDTLACDDGDPCTVPDVCKDGVCTSTPLNCDDNNSCTIDACDGNGGCKNVVVDGKDCDDGDACTVADTCVNSQCVGKTKSCDDGNQCTTDACKGGTCVFTTATGLACDDANACTENDKCTGAGICAGSLLDCSTGTVCKTFLTCSPITGCVTVQNDSALCDDGDFCTSGNAPGSLGDKCSGGGCSGPTISCDDQNICTNDTCDKVKGCVISQNTCDDNNSCTVDTCDKVLGCQHENVDGGACDDGDACTQQTTCVSGTCGGPNKTPVNCDDKNDCTADTCDAATGCANVAMADGSTCTDGLVCTTDSCVGGSCVGVTVDCDDKNPCTVDSCNTITGCVHLDAPEGGSCDDGEPCTVNTVCQGGACSGGTLDTAACPAWCDNTKLDSECAWLDPNNNACDGTFRCVNKPSIGHYVCVQDLTVVQCDSTGDGPCLHNTCNAATGKCAMTESVNGEPCEDGKGCTVNDSCYNGSCKAGTLNDCAGTKDACNSAACVEDPNAVKGFKCVALPLDATVLCDADSNGCTANDHCSAGKCVSGDSVDCTGIAGTCQVGSCKSTGTNTFTCQTSTAADNTACDDKQLCTTGDFCKAGKCQGGTGSYDCSKQTGVCSLGVCDKTANGGFGACVPTPQNEGQPCDSDGNGCTQGDKCVQGSCVPGTAPDCTGSTTDCATGSCKATGTSTFSCIGAPKVDNLPCEADQNGCTVGDACKSGKCTPGTQPDCSSLNGNKGCTVGVCSSLGNSQYTCIASNAAVGTICDSDGSGCTKGDACNALGACVTGPSVDCNTLTNACATGACVSTGAQSFVCNGTPKANGTACDADANGCTQNDSCQNGACKAGAAPDCGTSSIQCVQKKCTSTSFDKYLCQDIALADNTACDADANGCTKDDACYAGSCNAGATQTCSGFIQDCSTAACASTGANSFNCNVTPVVSYPDLSPAVSCVSTDSPTTCPANYKCNELDATTHAGECVPTVKITCNDNNVCTMGDTCVNGACQGGTATSCDDNDICTTDACDAKTGACNHTAIAGCGKCLDETFDPSKPATTNLVVRSHAATKLDWTYNTTNGDYEIAWTPATWIDPQTNNTTTRLEARKLYLQSGFASALEFDLTMTGTTVDCSVGKLRVLINDVEVKNYCDAVVAGTHQSIDLSAWAGAPIDVVFETAMGPVKPTGNIGMAIDNLAVKGLCSTTCVGVDFEPRGASDVDTPYVMPQAWKATTTDATYVNWATAATAGHTGTSELVANWTGKPTSATPQVAKLTIPQVSVATGNVLFFAVKTSFGDAACGTDDLSVRVNTAAGTVVELLKQCDNTSGWAIKSYDLAQFVNTTIDIDIVVTTGGGSTAKGVVEIDDVAITGACTYLCLSDDFESGGIAKWTTTTTDSVSKFAAWKASTTYAVSGTTSAAAQYDTNATDGKMAYITGTAAKGMVVQLPVLGATFSVQTNSFVANAPANCATTASSGVVWTRVAAAAAGYTPPATIAALAADLTQPLVNWGCDTSNGWIKATGPLSPKTVADLVFPSFYLVKQAGSTQGKIYIDDVKIICQ